MTFLLSQFSKVTVPSLQIHATQACNFSCDGCTSFSQFKLKGMLSPETAKASFDAWRKKILPRKVCLLGGEPTLNPHLCELLELMGRAFSSPQTKRLLTTNASFLDRHPNLKNILRKFDIEIRISVHSDEPSYLEKIRSTIKEIETWKGVSKLFTNNSGKPIAGFQFSDEKWTQRYRIQDNQLLPFNDGNSRKSWEVCTAKMSLQLFDGKLWKCPNVTYLRLVPPEKRLSPDWEPFLSYRPLESHCSREELIRFVGQQEERICGLCPTRILPFEKEKPFRNLDNW